MNPNPIKVGDTANATLRERQPYCYLRQVARACQISACRRCHRPICCLIIPFVRSNCCVWSLPIMCSTSGGKTRSYPPQSSVCHFLQLVFPSVLTINSVWELVSMFTYSLHSELIHWMKLGSCQPNNPLLSIPDTGTDACFFGRMTKTHHC